MLTGPLPDGTAVDASTVTLNSVPGDTPAIDETTAPATLKDTELELKPETARLNNTLNTTVGFNVGVELSNEITAVGDTRSTVTLDTVEPAPDDNDKALPARSVADGDETNARLEVPEDSATTLEVAETTNVTL